MLSIAKLAAGGQRYYLDQAKARVDHERSVASGVEDYYLSGREPAGRWVGSVAERAGVGGDVVAEDQLHWALSWADPLTGNELEGAVQHARVPGFDLMFRHQGVRVQQHGDGPLGRLSDGGRRTGWPHTP